jgi:hypothetical protein
MTSKLSQKLAFEQVYTSSKKLGNVPHTGQQVKQLPNMKLVIEIYSSVTGL